ncbi:arylamine N-acetyltransferase family protein [Actinoplanes sp. RD1]|uniref:arylamine N-acetyltransferase family protein n=1 Tax=Actinoplanes sp. RD1 TaxID=3064538 RepID=UPI0027420708|nr:arylamine N-acetyltransferase [Actinoplanes sp. RD1]
MTSSMWRGDDVDLDAYLARVGLRGDVAPDLATLRALHTAHVDAIAFDNLDAILDRAVPVDLDSVQDKLVRQARGGWCLEHVVLIAAVLDRIGYTFTALATRSRIRTGNKFGPAVHIALRVELDGVPWLFDVSFGGFGLSEPIRIAEGARVDGNWSFDVVREPAGEWVLRLLRPDGPADVYGFTEDRRYPADFEVLNHWCRTDERSPFNKKIILQRTRPELRHVLIGSTLTELRPGRPPVVRELDEDALLAAPAELFGVTLAPDDLRALAKTLPGGA